MFYFLSILGYVRLEIKILFYFSFILAYVNIG